MKLLSLFLALFLLLPVISGCGNKEKNPSDQTDTTEAAPVISLNLSSVQKLYVVRPENGTKDIIDEMKLIGNLIKPLTGADIIFSDDWYKNDSEIDRAEIIIGKTDRPEVAEEYSSLRADDYAIRFSGKKLWIVGGSEEATLTACSVFREMLEGMTSLSFEASGGLLARFTGTYEINETMLLGKPFRDYKIIYSSGFYQQTGAVNAFLSDVKEKSGYVLETSTNFHAESECAIRLKQVYQDGGSVELYDYSIESNGTDITVYGGSNMAFRKALGLIFEGFASGKLAASEEVLSESGSFSYLKDNYYDVLKDLRMYAIGDSYFAGPGLESTQVWPALLASKYGMKFLNYGIGGSTISNYTTEHNPMVDRINKMSRTSPDIVLFEGGRNDFNFLSPIGDEDSRDSRTFRGAIRLCIEKIHEMYPNALIVCITNWNYPGSHGIADCFGYASVFEKTAGEYDYAVCINATDRNIIPVDASNEKFRTEFFNEPTDVSHLNAAGMRYVVPYFEEQIAKSYAAFLEGKLR
ncbi:MAG: SGNH/GDSL hydrolase family protein [Clostridia bacterium]|nr:SGNH/GDSL hydrolase family protein [Clostridia bacterium]